MLDAVDLGKRLLAAILPQNGDAGNKELLEQALRQVSPEHFADPQQRMLFQMLEWWLTNVGTVLPVDYVGSYFRDSPPGVALQHTEYYRMVQAEPGRPEEFGHYVEQLRELAATRMTGEALTQGMQVLRGGAQDGEEWLQGHAAAREHVLARFAEVEHALRLQESPEGDVRNEAQEFMAEYNHRAEQSRRGYGVIHTGLADLDEALGGGIQPGELVLVAAGSNVGKSTMCADWAWRACVEQGLNVVIFTSETNRIQFRNKIIARHSRLWGSHLPSGLDTRDLRAGKIPQEHVQYLASVVKHFADTPSHGRCWIAQVPRGATIGTLEARLARVSKMFPAHLVIIDYLMLLRSDRKRQSRREELSEIVVQAKEMATGYQDGRGVSLVSPWQMNREGNKQARDVRGFYSLDDLAETAEASCTADVILGLLPDGDDDSLGRAAPLKVGTVKVRDGAKLRNQIHLKVDYGTCLFRLNDDTAQQAQAMQALGAGTMAPV